MSNGKNCFRSKKLLFFLKNMTVIVISNKKDNREQCFGLGVIHLNDCFSQYVFSSFFHLDNPVLKNSFEDTDKTLNYFNFIKAKLASNA
jgi:hypothetical protein